MSNIIERGVIMFVLPELQPSEVIIYLRKSRTDDPSLTVSDVLSKHEQMLDDFSQRTWGALIPEQNRFREVVSGETIKDRPEINKVLRLIEQDCYKAILIVEPQRLSRGDLEDIGRLSKLLRYTNTIVITLQYTYDLSDERDRDYFERELKRGNEFLEYSKRIMHNGLTLSAQNGNYLGSSPPFGYTKTSFKEGKRTAHSLEPIPEQAEIVRMVFEMFADGTGTHAIAEKLNALGIPAPRADFWTPPTIFRMLRNPHYIGKVRYYFRRQKIVVVDGQMKKQRKASAEPELYNGKHQAIITPDLWERVQYRVSTIQPVPVRDAYTINNPLAGVLYCVCGRAMVLRPQVGTAKPRYSCPQSKICHNAGCLQVDILDAVSASMRQELADLSATVGKDSTITDRAGTHVKQARKRLADLEQKESAIWEKYAEGMPRQIFEGLLSKNKQEKEAAEKELQAAETAFQVQEVTQDRTLSLYQAIQAMQDEARDIRHINDILRACIARITYSRERTGKRGNTAPARLKIEYRL